MVKSTKRIVGDQRPLSGSKEADNSNQLKELGWGVSEDRYRMDSNKLPWHKERLKDWANMKKIAPMHIDMGIATGCNLGCHFCYGVVQARNGFLGKQGKMNFMPQETIINTFSILLFLFNYSNARNNNKTYKYYSNYIYWQSIISN